MSKICNKYNINFSDVNQLALWLLAANLLCYFLIYFLKIDLTNYYPYVESCVYSVFNIFAVVLYYGLNLKLTGVTLKSIFEVNRFTIPFIFILLFCIYAFSFLTNMLTEVTVTQTFVKYSADFVTTFNPIYAVVAIALAAFKEELIFREVAQAFLLNKFSVCVACVGSSIIFTLFHVGYSFDVFTVLYYLLFGVVFFLVRYKSGSLVPVITAHCVINLIAFL